MLSRGYTGRMPAVWQGAGAATAGQWLVAATVPVLAAGIAATAVVLT
jgi:cobalt/nickel transport system permease protein